MPVPAADGSPQPSTPDTRALIVELAASTTPTATAPVASANLEAPAAEAPRVLLVEDSPSVRQVQTYFLEDAGFVVAVATKHWSVRSACRTRWLSRALRRAGCETRI